MKVVKEPGFQLLKQAERAAKQWTRRNIRLACHSCGEAHAMVSAGCLNKMQGKWKCRDCKAKDQAALQQALINTAKRKVK